MEELQQPLKPATRLNCRCIVGDGMEIFRVILTKTNKHVQATGADLTKMKAGDKKVTLERVQRKIEREQSALVEGLNALKREHEIHKTRYRAEYARSMIDLAKKRSINVGKSSEPLRTNGWKTGDVQKLREGPKNARKGRKRRKKK
jgi:hypothetical protein